MQKILLPTLIVGIICTAILATNWFVGKMACPHAELPIRQFMAERIEQSGNTGIVISFLMYMPNYNAPEVLTWQNVPWSALLPSYVLSELKAAFPFGVIALGTVGLALVTTRRRVAEPQSENCDSVLSAITWKFIVISVLVAIFLMMLIFTELPKIPLVVTAFGSIGLVLVVMRRNGKTEPQS